MVGYGSDEAWLEDDEYPDDDYSDDDSSSDFNENDLDYDICPHCQAEISDASVQCPICGEYITFSTSMWEGKGWWWVTLGLLGMAATTVVLTLLF